MPRINLRRSMVFLTFLAMIVLGLGLSWFISHTGAQIKNVSSPLLKEKLPQLDALSQTQRALQAYQIALNQYYAASISRATYLQRSREIDDEVRGLLISLQEQLGGDARLLTMRQRFHALSALGPRLDQILTYIPEADDVARQLLVDLAAGANGISTELASLKRETEQAVYRGGELTTQRVDLMTWLVRIYSLAIIVIAVLVGYYISARLRAEQELAFQASHDLLTGLRNRRRFEETLRQIVAQPKPCHVMIVYLDRVRRITAGLGHEATDQLLRAAAARLNQTCQGLNARLFRYEGVSFALLCPVEENGPDAQALAWQLAQVIEPPFVIDRHELFATVSIGSALFPQDGRDPVALIRNADAALQLARSAGGDGYQVYTPEINARALDRLALETRLRHALERDELELHYQPQLSLHSRQLVGVECLVRWRSEGKLISPAEFIPLAEESGLIIPIGTWVLRTACRQALAWQHSGLPPLVVAVNISAKQFQHPDFLDVVARILSETGVNPDVIELEITESVVMHDAEHVAHILQRLRDMRLKLSIDDFGTGYSSLAYLKRFPIHKIKIDQSFVRNLAPGSGDAAIVEAVIRLGHSMGMTVIAEGVETSVEFDYLNACGCDEIQGYYYSRPQALEAATAFLQGEAARQVAA